VPLSGNFTKNGKQGGEDMFLTRTISGIVLVILAFGAIWAGDWVLLLTIYAVSVMGFFELTGAM